MQIERRVPHQHEQLMGPSFKISFFFALLYSLICILFKVYVIQSGLILTNFGFYYSHAITVLFLIPYFFLSLWYYRKKIITGTYSGRQGFKFLMEILVFSILCMSVYHYAEFEWKLKELACQYYRSELYLNFLKKQSRLKPEDYPKIIEEQIRSASAFKAVTSKILSYLIIGGSGAFFCALIQRKN
ncbi:MAG: DUF4199 domain-containing protein [Bacteroidia bacterium]|nr:DUF4199 domain-containing protein [Bacteroidia bacterium]